MDKTAQVCRWRNVFSIPDWHRGENVLSPSDRFLSKQRRGERLFLFLFLSYFSVPFFRFREKGAVASPTTTGLRAWGEKFSLCEVPPPNIFLPDHVALPGSWTLNESVTNGFLVIWFPAECWAPQKKELTLAEPIHHWAQAVVLSRPVFIYIPLCCCWFFVSSLT